MNIVFKLILFILCILAEMAFADTLLDKATEGHPNSQFELALKDMSSSANYISDWLLISALQDHKKAIHYMRKISDDEISNALSLRNSKSQVFLETYLPLLEVEKKELNRLRKKGNSGDIDTQYLLWLLYVNDKGVKKSEAYTWLKQAAGNNHSRALFSLGLLYFYGYIVPEEIKKAENLISQSSILGFNLATEFLKKYIFLIKN
jgi:TPR repeat protein